MATIAVVAFLAGALEVMAGGTVADRVLGQPVPTSGGANLVGSQTLYAPSAVAIDRSVIPSRVYVADTRNNRVLGWKNAGLFENGSAANIVLGQPDFLHSGCNTDGFGPSSLCAPAAVAVDAKGNVYVSDTGNNRVLKYDSPFTGGRVAKRVFGQNGNFATTDCNGGGVSATSLCSPNGLAVDAKGPLYVADTGNSRVLEYDSPLSNARADRVFGQAGRFNTNNCNAADRSANSLCSPSAIALDSEGRLYVADTGNSRVLGYDRPLANTSAVRVFGQGGNFVNGACNGAGLSGAEKLCEPNAVAFDRIGHLYVADTLNNCVLEYDTPLKTEAASRVFGQGGSFATSDCNEGGLSDRSLCEPHGLAVGDAGNLFVADSGNNRVLEYNSPMTDVTASRVLGQPSFSLNGVNLVGRQGLRSPLGVAIDCSVTPNRVYVADGDNNRVLGWSNARDLKDGASADVLLGQPDFQHGSCNTAGLNAQSLCGPSAVTVDGQGHLYVADTGNYRVLEYDSPFNPHAAANRVYGQAGSFTTNDCDKNGVSADSLCMPTGLTVDQTGHLYVADTLNHRVLEYISPLKSTAADRAFGQHGLTSTGCNTDGTVSGKSMCKPGGVAVDGEGHLYVADTGNSRVVEFGSPADSVTPNRVFGQNGGFTANDCNGGGLSATTLCDPGGVAVDKKGRLYVADAGNSRVVEYDHPLENAIGTRVFGQLGSFSANGCNANGLNAESLCDPNGIALDADGNLFVADAGNHRVLKYNSPLSGAVAH